MKRLKSTDLTPSERNILSVFAKVDYGSVFELRVKDGQPIQDPAPRIVRDIRMKCSPPPKDVPLEFVLKEQMVTFLETTRRITDGVVDEIQIKGGLPFSMRIEGLDN